VTSSRSEVPSLSPVVVAGVVQAPELLDHRRRVVGGLAPPRPVQEHAQVLVDGVGREGPTPGGEEVVGGGHEAALIHGNGAMGS